MNKYLAGLTLLISLNSSAHTSKDLVLDSTMGNPYGITQDEVCTIKKKKNKISIHCARSKQKFEHVHAIENYALLGTPPHLVYANYIGYRKTKPSTPGLMGSGKMTVYCNGPCQRKEKRAAAPAKPERTRIRP